MHCICYVITFSGLEESCEPFQHFAKALQIFRQVVGAKPLHRRAPPAGKLVSTSA